jgi:anti-anti-sigma regulatory factor
MMGELCVAPRFIHIDEELAAIDFSGKLTLRPSLGLLQKRSRQILKGNKMNGLIIGLAEVSIADSSGLAELTQVYSIATNCDCGLRLLGVSAQFA